MATYVGSGNFVGVTAGRNDYFPESTSQRYGYGISFGKDRKMYCSVGPRYFLKNGTVEKTSLAVEANTDKDAELQDYSLLALQFPNLQRLRVNGKTGYTGSIRVVSWIECNEKHWDAPDTTIYSTYRFRCGLLVQATRNT